MAEQEKKTLRVPCEIYSRIVGYMRPVRDWNKGKVQEWRERKVYNAPEEGQGS